jgi:hypothetical protein
MSTVRLGEKVPDVNGAFGCRIRPLDDVRTEFAASQAMMMTVSTSHMRGDRPSLSSIDPKTILGLWTRALVSFLAKVHWMSNTNINNGDNTGGDKYTIFEMLPAKDAVTNEFYFEGLSRKKKHSRHGNSTVSSSYAEADDELLAQNNASMDEANSRHRLLDLEGNDDDPEETYLETCPIPPVIDAVRIYWIGSYDKNQVIETCLAANRKAYFAMSTKPVGRSGQAPCARELDLMMRRHGDQSLIIHSREDLAKALTICRGKLVPDEGMDVVMREAWDSPDNPMWIGRSLGLATAVDPNKLSIHPTFRNPSMYVSSGTATRPLTLRLPHPEMAFMMATDAEQVHGRVMNTILPAPVPKHLQATTREEVEYTCRFTGTDHGIPLADCVEESEAERGLKGADEVYARFGSSTTSVAADKTFESMYATAEQERNEFHTNRVARKKNRRVHETDEDLSEKSWDEFVTMQSRQFFRGSSLLDPKNKSHSVASEAAMVMLTEYLATHDGVLFRLQTRAFKNLTRLSSWLVTRGISLELIYGVALAHQMVLRMMLSALNAPDMNPDKIHHLAIGAGGTSKSFGLDIVISWAIPGQADDVSHKTAMADTVPVNKDGSVEAWHEGNPEWFGVGANGKTAPTPQESRFKKRLTSGVMTTESCSMDDNGDRINIMYRRPCNLSVLVNLNLNLGQISQPMLTRFLVSQSVNVPRPGKSMAHCICESSTAGERITKQADREGMQWLSMMITLVHLLIRVGCLPQIRLPVLNSMTPKILGDAAMYGLNHLDAPRHLLRLTAAVRAFVVVRAILFVFGSPVSPLAVHDPGSIRCTGRKFSMHSFALLAFHLTDAWDPTILSAAMGMVKDQWESRTRYPVIEGLMSLFFPCGEEGYDGKAEAESRAKDVEGDKNLHKLVESTIREWATRGIVYHKDERADINRALSIPTVVQAFRASDPSRVIYPANHAIRVMLAGGSDAVRMLAAPAQAGGSAPLRQAPRAAASCVDGNVRSLLAPGQLRVPPQTSRRGRAGHPATCCSCCVCVACVEDRAASQPEEAPYLKLQDELCEEKVARLQDRFGQRRNTIAHGQNPAFGSLAEPDRLVDCDDPAEGGAGKYADKDGVCQHPMLSRAASLDIAYAARRNSDFIDTHREAQAMGRVEIDRALQSKELDVLETDSRAIANAKVEREHVLLDDMQRRIRRARHLEQAQYSTLGSPYSDNLATRTGVFHKDADRFQCIAEVSKQICRTNRSLTPGGVGAMLRQMMETTTPVTVNGTTTYMKSLQLNSIQNGVTVSKAMLINNRQGILEHLLREMFGHRFTISYTHLFGEDPDPEQPPYLFKTFVAIPSRRPPYQPKRVDKQALMTVVLAHNASHSTDHQGIVRERDLRTASRTLECPPEVQFGDDFLNDGAVPPHVALKYRFLPSYVIMRLEAEHLVSSQIKWVSFFKAHIEARIGEGVSVKDAFGSAWLVIGQRPADMISYPPIATNLDNKDVVTGEKTDSEWCLDWGWADRAKAVAVARDPKRAALTITEFNAQSPFVMKSYPRYYKHQFRHFIEGKQQDVCGLTDPYDDDAAE